MKLLFLTNMPSYHQMELAAELASAVGSDNFRIAFYAPISDERLGMQWQDNYQANYLLRYSGSVQDKAQVQQWIEQADVVIQGRFPIKHLRKRIATGKLTFAYQERFWKKGYSIKRLIGRLPYLYKNYWSVNRANYHLLAAGSYVANDLTRLGLFKGRCWKFGYFINADSATPPKQTVLQQDSKVRLVWCARMIDCKLPEQALQIAAGLRDRGVDFELNMIGGGELLESVQAEVDRLELNDVVTLLGWKTVDEVNALMALADISLMTSDHREGWGLVINEAINNRCMMVVSDAAGAAKWLVEDGQTGLIYAKAELQETIEKLAVLCRDKAAITAMAERGFAKLSQQWSTQQASERILQLSQALIQDADAVKTASLFSDGPCSPA